MIRLGFAMVVAAAAVGCAGDDDGGGGGLGGTGPVTMAQAQDLCMTSCTHEDTCGTLDTAGGETVESCTADCVGDISGGGYRQDATQAVVDCMTASCSNTGETCLSACTPTSAHESYETACRAKVTACGGAGSDADSACETMPGAGGDSGFFCLLTPTVMNALTACFDMGCDQIDACFEMVLAQYGINN